LIHADYIVGWALAHRFLGINDNLNNQPVNSVFCHLSFVGWALIHRFMVTMTG